MHGLYFLLQGHAPFNADLFYLLRPANDFPRRYEKVMSCFDELKLGRVDVIVTDLPVALSYVAAENSPFIIVWENPEPEIFGICMKKGNDALTGAINNALEEMFEDGTMSKISFEHLLGDDAVVKARQLW